MRRKLTIIFAAFSLSFVLMVSLSVFSIIRFTTFTDYSNEVTQSNKAIRAMYRAEVLLKDLDRWERGYMVSRDTVYLRVLGNAFDSLYPAMDEMTGMLTYNPEQTKNTRTLKNHIDERIKYAKANLAYLDTTTSKQTSAFYFEGREHMIKSNRLLRKMHQLENEKLAARFVKQQFYQQLTTSTIKSLLIVFCLVTLVLFAMLMRLMRKGLIMQEVLRVKVNDLRKSHNELQDIAYSVSHDLQEPLRKIQVFANMLLYKQANSLDKETTETISKIDESAKRMHSLVHDLSTLASLTGGEENLQKTSLDRVLQHVLIDLSSKIKELKATINYDTLPEVKGHENQLKILFNALLDNALKFRKPNVPPIINIKHKKVTAAEIANDEVENRDQSYYCVTISDNGIGIDNQYVENIFRLFRRLHSSQSNYEGKGIGLAICQRIMTNHQGYITGEGNNEGASFSMYFPI